jgi:CIC family chloride channel protein
MVKRLLKEPRKMAERVHDGMSGMGRRIAVLKFDASHMCDMRIRRTILVSVYAVFVGIVAGVGAGLFRYMIALAHNLFFNGEFDFVYDSTRHVESPFGWWWALLVPPAGMLVVVFLTRKFAPEAKGHGVPEVMQALVLRGGRIRPRVAIAKIVASALCIGTGGSAGREGPIVQVGASLGSGIGQVLHLSDERIKNLVSCGAAAGIAATFNAPIAGVAFAIEVLMSEFRCVHNSSEFRDF